MPVFLSQRALTNTIDLRVKQALQESSKRSQLDLFELSNTPYLDVVRNIASKGRYYSPQNNITTAVKNAMLKDAIISRVINMWISDTLQEDVLTKDVYQIDVETIDATEVKEESITEIKDLIEYFRYNSNIDKVLQDILYQIIVYGNSVVRLGFLDNFEETKIKLFESNKQKILNETESLTSKELFNKLYEDDNFDYNNFKELKKKKALRLKGKYYIELLPHTLNALENKGVTVLYLDLNNPNKVLNPYNITNFTNKRGNVITLSVKSSPDDVVSDNYTLSIGESFIDNAVMPWSMLNSVEDCTMLALLTRSAIYRLFQVDVGAMSAKETDKFILDFKNRLQTRESIDIRSQYYNSVNTTLPLGDSIIIPTRNGVGTVNLQTVGNDLSIDTEGPLKYFRQQLLAALGVPEGLIYGDTGNGGLINTSATKQDIRYLRTIQQFTSLLKQGLVDIYKDYLTMVGVDISKYVISVNFAQINSEQDLNRIEYEQTKLEAFDRLISSLQNIGITFEEGKYKETKELLVSRYLDSDILDAIKSDEEKQPDLPPEEQDKDDSLSKRSSHSPSLRPDINIDINEGPENTNEEIPVEDIDFNDTSNSNNPMLNLDDMSTLETPTDQSGE